MNACPGIERLQHLLDEQLSDEERPDVVAHVERCESCQTRLEEWTRFEMLGRPSSRSLDSASDTAVRSSSSEAAVGMQRFSFLGPSRGEGELGWLAHYRVQRVLGEGGMGAVFLAEDMELRRPVALKVLKPELVQDVSARQRFLREARALAAMHDEHIITIYQVGQEQDLPFLAMEYLEGEPLDQRLRRELALPIREVLRIGRETAQGLAAAHAKGLVHRDIKPANLWLVAPTGQVKILDFGLALAPQDQIHLTRNGCVVGTPSYMAPEQARGESIDHRCDLFSLGCVLYHLATGSRPFVGETTMALLTALALDRPRPLRGLNTDCPVALEELVQNLLEKKPEDRPQSAQEVVQSLQSLEPLLMGADVPEKTSPVKSVPQALFLPTPATREQHVALPSSTRNFLPASGRSRWRLAVTLPCGLAVCLIGLLIGFRSLEKTGPGPSTENGPGEKAANVRTISPIVKEPATEGRGPFVLIRGSKGTQQKFEVLTEALSRAQLEDVIEVQGNGPFSLGRVHLQGKNLSLRAAPGYRPRFVSGAGDELRAGYWFGIDKGALDIQGCDFQISRPNLGWLKGGGGHWVIRDCQVVSAACPDQFGPSVISYTSGPELRCEDCFFLQWRAGVGILHDVAAGARLKLTNNLLVCLAGNTLVGLHGRGGQTVQLEGNTFVAFPYMAPRHGCSLLADRRFAEAVTIQARGNLCCFPGGSFDGLPVFEALLNQRLHWRGERNYYAGLTANLAIPRRNSRGLAAWQNLAEQEKDSQEAPQVLFAWQLLQLPIPVDMLGALQSVLARHRDDSRADFGPDLELVGTGEAYVHAGKAQGHSLAPLRPLPGRGGPFVLLRDGLETGSHSSLAAVALTAQDGDTIEVRTNETFRSDPISGNNRTLTLRAGIGYRPILQDGLIWSDDTLTVEGLEMSRGGMRASGPNGRIVRLANCAIEGPVDLGTEAERSLSRQIDNCLIQGRVQAPLQADQQLTVQNTVLSSVWVGMADQAGPARVNLQRCLCWNASSSPLVEVDRGPLHVLVERTLIASVGGLAADARSLASWVGRDNKYLLGQRNWYSTYEQTPVVGLEEWRRAWQSDVESTAEDPPFFDPRQWRLLPGSPGSRKGPDGKDFGADLDRVARTLQ